MGGRKEREKKRVGVVNGRGLTDGLGKKGKGDKRGPLHVVEGNRV